MTDRHRWSNDDEVLSALLDGELPPEDAARLRERLAEEPALAERLEHLARSDATLRDAYAGIADEPLPQSVLELLQPGQPGDAATSDAAKVVELRPKRTEPARSSALPVAVAAGIALVVGVLVGYVVAPGGASSPSAGLVAGAGAVEPGSALHAVLESVPSAETRELAASLAATPRLTFRAQGGGYCRHVDVAGAQGTTQALACRRMGGWRVEVASFMPAPGNDGAYRPAAGDATPVRAAVDSMIAGAPLDADAERTLISSGWAASR